MRTVYCHQCTQISCIRKILKRKPASFWKTNRKIRIQYFKKLKAILYLLLCHIKFISLLTSGYDHQIINDQLLFTGFYRFPHGACTPREYLLHGRLLSIICLVNTKKPSSIRIFPYLIFFPFSFSTPVLLSSQHFLSYQKSPVPYTSFDNFRSLDIINREILPQGGFLLWTILFSV